MDQVDDRKGLLANIAFLERPPAVSRPISARSPGGHQAAALARRYVFVCGLHRSGTSLLTQCLAAHPQISGFSRTGFIEDEGQYLQSVLPQEYALGGPGRFGFDPRAHLTEDSALNTDMASRTLLADWSRYWDMQKPVLVEKTPSNLLRMRLLNELLRPSYFIVVTRHPVAASLATLKWSRGTVFKMLTHWLHCHRIAKADCAALERVIWVSYESLVVNPERELLRLTQFLGLPALSHAPANIRNANAAYFERWNAMFLGDRERAVPPARHPRDVAKTWLGRMRERHRDRARETAGPDCRSRGNIANHYDALDAAGLLNGAFAEFGYSLTDLAKTPRY